MWVEDIDKMWERVEEEMAATIEKYRFNRLLNIVISRDNTDEENELWRQAIDRLTALWIDAYLIEASFVLGLTGESIMQMDEAQIQMLVDSYYNLQSATKPVYYEEGPFRKRYHIREWAFDEFKATIEMLSRQISWTYN